MRNSAMQNLFPRRPRRGFSRLRACSGRAWAATLMCTALFASSGCSQQSAAPKLSPSNLAIVEAQEAYQAGQLDVALERLEASIAAEPTIWALRLRARIRAEQGEDAGAKSDCEAALQLAPDDPDVLWIQGELAKPADKRFQGRFKTPPSASR